MTPSTHRNFNIHQKLVWNRCSHGRRPLTGDLNFSHAIPHRLPLATTSLIDC
jgi:hypothetical protein